MLSSTSPVYHPVRFLDRLEGNNHVVMLYDDEKNADLMIARYFQNGLNKGDSCVFLTDGDTRPVEGRLASEDIDVYRYVEENKLRVFGTRSMAVVGTDVLRAQKAITAESTKGKPPFRLAGRAIPDIESVNGMLQGMQLETTGQERLSEFGISLLCFYDVRKLEGSRRDERVRGLLENHRQEIYASDPGKAVGFETSLLEEEG